MLRLPLVVSLLLLHFATSFLWDDLLVLLRDSNDSVPGVRWYSNNSLIADTPDGAFVLPMNDRYVSNALLRYGQWEKPLLDLVCAVLDAALAASSNDNDGLGGGIVLLDVGSNVGAWAVPLARRYAARGGRVFAYEPQIDLLMYLSATSLLNALENIVPVHAAVTNVTGWSRIRHIVREKEAVHNFAAFTIESLNVNHTSDASGGETSGTGPFKPLSDTSYVVPHVTLDDLFYQQGAFACPSLIKLDIEVSSDYTVTSAATTGLRYPPCPLQ
jgi:FkbM family methyltransferase